MGKDKKRKKRSSAGRTSQETKSGAKQASRIVQGSKTATKQASASTGIATAQDDLSMATTALVESKREDDEAIIRKDQATQTDHRVGNGLCGHL